MLHDFVGRRNCRARCGSTPRSAAWASCSARSSARRCCSGWARPRGIFANIAIYLPLTLFLFRTRFTGHTRDGGVAARRGSGMLDSLRVLRRRPLRHTLVP